MKKRFVHLVTRHWPFGETIHSVRRIDPHHHFFYGSAAAALRAADDAARKKEPFPATQTLQLPSPIMSFDGKLDMFALLGGRGLMVYASPIGEAGVYDADRHIQYGPLHRLNPKGFKPMCLSIAHPDGEDSLYVMSRYLPKQGAGRCFEVLEPAAPPDLLGQMKHLMITPWRWRLLPSPPFPRAPPDPFHHQQFNKYCSVTSFATVVDGRSITIYISCGSGLGTYSFKTAGCGYLGRSPGPEEWSHVGEWRLPFIERAHYVPEFNLWFGILASSPHHLCAVDLSSAAMDRERGRPPAVQQVWQDLDPPEGEELFARRLELVDLGDGKFLIAKTFEAEANPGEQFAVLIGVEMMMAGVGGDQSIQMVKHKSARFDFIYDTIEWVL